MYFPFCQEKEDEKVSKEKMTWLRHLRKKFGLEQKEIAALVGMPAASLCRKERGQTPTTKEEYQKVLKEILKKTPTGKVIKDTMEYLSNEDLKIDEEELAEFIQRTQEKAEAVLRLNTFRNLIYKNKEFILTLFGGPYMQGTDGIWSEQMRQKFDDFQFASLQGPKLRIFKELEIA